MKARHALMCMLGICERTYKLISLQFGFHNTTNINWKNRTSINWKDRTDHSGSKTVLICNDLILSLQQPFMFAKLENVSNKFRNVNIREPYFLDARKNFEQG